MSYDDQAEAVEQTLRDAALSYRKPVLEKKGTCYNCDEPVTGFFCDQDCSKDYEDRNNGLE